MRIVLPILIATGPSNGSIQIDPNNPSFDIKGGILNIHIPQFTAVNTIGRTTGWTTGFVSNTCIDRPSNSRPNLVWECQFVVNDSGNPVPMGGDSGAPVLIYEDGSRGNYSTPGYYIAGIVSISDMSDNYTFSSYTDIAYEFSSGRFFFN